MTPEIVIDTRIIGSPERIEGHDYKASSIRWDGSSLKLDGLDLPYGWEEVTSELKGEPPQWCGDWLKFICEKPGFDWKLAVNKKTGLITEITLQNDRLSRIYLDTSFGGMSGVYKSEKINDLMAAVVYQDFFGHYFNYLSKLKKPYPYIQSRGNYCSIDLNVPQEILDSKEPVTDIRYQDHFKLAASNIAGQFGTTFQDARFDEKGVLQVIQLEESERDCYYKLDEAFCQYYPGDELTLYEVATLHAIAVKFIGDLRGKDDLEE